MIITIRDSDGFVEASTHDSTEVRLPLKPMRIKWHPRQVITTTKAYDHQGHVGI